MKLPFRWFCVCGRTAPDLGSDHPIACPSCGKKMVDIRKAVA